VPSANRFDNPTSHFARVRGKSQGKKLGVVLPGARVSSLRGILMEKNFRQLTLLAHQSTADAAFDPQLEGRVARRPKQRVIRTYAGSGC